MKRTTSTLLLLLVTALVHAHPPVAHSLEGGRRVRAVKEWVILEDDRGRALDRFNLTAPVVGLASDATRIFAATRFEGIWIFTTTLTGKLKKMQHLRPAAPVRSIGLRAGVLFVMTVRQKVSTWIISGKEVRPYRKGASATPVTSRPRERRERIAATVVSIRRGLAVIDAGRRQGLHLGDRLSIVSQQRRSEYDPLRDAIHKRISGREVAVLEIVELTDTTAVVKLGLGDDVHQGDLAFYTMKAVKSSKQPARRWGGMQRLQADFYPGFLLGDTSFTAAFAYHYHAEEPVHFSMAARPWLFSKVRAMDLALRGGFETSSFEVGLGVSAILASYVHEDSSKTLSDARVFFEMYMRLGALDGLNWELGIRSSPADRDNTFSGMWTSLQWSGYTHLLSLTFDQIFVTMRGPDDLYHETDMVFVTTTFRDRIRLWGNGGPGTLYLPVFIGMTACTGDTGDKFSFIMGGGVEYRW